MKLWFITSGVNGVLRVCLAFSLLIGYFYIILPPVYFASDQFGYIIIPDVVIQGRCVYSFKFIVSLIFSKRNTQLV